MNLYQIDFVEIGQAVGWFTYDIRASNVFEATCELFRCCGAVVISNIREC